MACIAAKTKALITDNKYKFVFLGIFMIFSIISGSCLILSGDDIWWAIITTLSEIYDNHIPNGRYFTNIITFFCCHCAPVRVIVYTVSLTGLFAAIAFLIGGNYKFKWLPFALAVLIMIFAQRPFLLQIINWTCGFTNYVISLLFTLIYFNYTKPVFDRTKPGGGIVKAVVFLVVGFLGALCIENMTIYNILFGIFVIVFSLVTVKKVTAANIAYLVGTAAGAVLMFSASNYNEIASGSDSVGLRSFEFAFDDIATKLYLEIIPFYACYFFMFHIIIAFSVLFIYNKKYRNESLKPKYAKLCVPVIIFYCIYSFVSVNVHELVITSVAYKARAFECAFAFMYVISLLYMVYHLLDGSKGIMSMIYLVSTLIVTGQFIVITPINHRCFFADYIFWSLFALSLLAEAVYASKVRESSCIRNSAIVLVVSALGFISFFDISNKYVDNLRIGYIREQLDRKQNNVEFIKLPYSNFAFDSADIVGTDTDFIILDGETWNYDKAYYKYNGIDMSVFDRVRVNIDMMDYNLSKES